MKNLLKNVLKVKVLIIVIVIVLVVTYLLSAFAYLLDLLDAINPNHSSSGSTSGMTNLNPSYYDNNMPAQIENEITNQITSSNIIYQSNGDYRLNIDLDEKINEIYNRMIENTEGQRVLNYLTGTEQEKKELLKNMLRAEIITQYPDLRQKEKFGTSVASNEVQGVIQIKRVLSQEIREVTNIAKSSNTSVELQKGVVCWGDQFTLGNEENEAESYPNILGNLLNSNAYNLGFKDESAEEILLRAGAQDCVFETTGEEFTIGSGVGAQATFTAQMKIGDTIIGEVFQHLDGTEQDKELECTISGAVGTLIYQVNQENQQGEYVFTRDEEGAEAAVSVGTEIVLSTQGGYDECIPVIWFGNNNSNFAIDEQEIYKLINYYNYLIDVLENPDDYIIIIPTYYQNTETEELVAYNDTEYGELKSRLESTFGVHCIDLKETSTDPSDYNGIANIIKNKLNSLGYDVGTIDELNIDAGNITFGNMISIGTQITLEYIPLGNALEPARGTLRWLIDQEDEDTKNAALQFFSIDSVGNLIIANWNRVTTRESRTTDGANDEGYPTEVENYELKLVKVNYKESVSQYTMPFDYLWTFLVMGEDQEFVNNLANLALDSEIIATLFDELTIVEDDYVENYTQENRTDVQENVTETNYETGDQNSYTNETSSQTSSQKYYNRNVVTETNKVKYRITKADVWFLTYEVTGITQEYDDGTNNTQVTETGPTTEEWAQTGSSGPVNSSNNITTYLPDSNTGLPVPQVTGRRDTIRYETYYSRRSNITTTTTIITSGYSYTEGVTHVEEKTDKTATEQEIATRTFADPNFVKYYVYSQNARINLTGIYSWLYEALEMNGKTAELVDITKYLIYKATDSDQGVTSIDFNAYNDSDFKDATEYDTGTGVGMSGEAGEIEDSNVNLGEAQVVGNGQFTPASNLNGGYYGYYTSSFGITYKLYYQNYNLSTGTLDTRGSGSRSDWGSGSGGLCGVTAYATMMSGFGSSETPGTLYSAYGYGAPTGMVTISYSQVAEYLRAGYPVRIGKNVSSATGLPGGNNHFVVVLDIDANDNVFVAETYYAQNGIKYTTVPLSNLSSMSQFRAYTR